MSKGYISLNFRLSANNSFNYLYSNFQGIVLQNESNSRRADVTSAG